MAFNSAEGDYRVALTGVPYEYGIGMGAGILAAPFAWVEDAIYGDPGVSEGWTEEVQEPPAGSHGAEDDVEVSESRREESAAVEESPS